MDQPIVQFDAVDFAHRAGAPVLHGVTLSCRAGETVVVVGRSGAGKSTLLKLVNRLLAPTSGHVRVQGKDTASWDPIRLRRSTGYVMQDAGLFPHMTVEENVSIVPRLEQWEPARIRERTRELLGLVGLPPDRYSARRPQELSGGERQRVGLARALAVDPPILLMDEPFGALDPITRKEVTKEFARIRQQLRTTALLVTHDMGEAFALADRIGVMDAGQLVALDTPDGLTASSDPRVQALLEPPPRRAVPR